MQNQNFSTGYAATKSGSLPVDVAIKKARIQLLFVPMGILLLMPIVSGILVGIKVVPTWFIAIGFLAGFLGSLLIWMMLIPKWKVWAFGNVRNVHELKSRAIMNRMIWPDHSFFSKLELWSTEDKRAWQEIKEKFKHPDAFIDDPSVPKETLIFYSRVSAYILFPLGIGSGFIGVTELLKDGDKTRGYVLSAFALIVIVVELRKLLIKKPRLTISNDGIEAAKVKFYPWNEIRNETIIREGVGKNIKFYLTYSHAQGYEKIAINEYGINRDKLHRLLILYRARFNALNKGTMQ